ncbi:kinase-like domain-containing protein [Scleroderma citrinum]
MRRSSRGCRFHQGTYLRSIQEVRQFSKLRHDNILPLLGITTKFDLTVSIVSPWMQRGNAHDYVQDKAIDPRPLIEGIARGLQYLHHHSEGAISHGNLKGRNVLISEDGQALLADFRISLYCNSLFSMSTSDYIGSALNWMAPEILDGCAASLEADVWAFGMMGLELFTRKDSFYGHRGTLGIVPRIAQGPPDRPGDEDTCFRMTNEWWNILASCWQSDPHSRPAVSDLLDTIVSLSRSKGNHLDTLSQLDPHTVVHRPDPRRMLEALVRQVSHNFPDINLDGRVDRNDNFVGRTISAATFLGTLRPSGAKVGVKIVCGDPPEDENTIKYLLDEVHVWSNVHCI